MQYSKTFADALQFVWGEGFLSPGGPEEVAEMLHGLDISGWRVLDVGSGLGGIDALLAARHGAGEVIGIDVEPQLIADANALVTAKGLGGRVRFQLVEPGPLPFEAASFDLVFSKDAMVHIPDKTALYCEALRVLRPGGWLVVADWLWAEGAETSPAVVSWLSALPLKFAFTTIAEARAGLSAAGFIDISITDQREALRRSNLAEVQALAGAMGQSLAIALGEDMARQRLLSARGRQAALDSGDLIPCHLRARKIGALQ